MHKTFLKSQPVLAMASWSMGWLFLSGAAASSQDLLPPGYEPRPLGLHALSGGNIIVSPSLTLTNAMLIIEGDTIVRVVEDLTPPTGARVWDMTGTTLYPGFIDPYVLTTTEGEKPQVTSTHAEEDATHRATGAWHFFGMTGDEEDPGEKGPGGSYHTVRSDYRVVDHWDFESDERKKWREMGFTAVQLSPSKGIWRGRGAVSLTGNDSPNRLLVQPLMMQHLALTTRSSQADEFPRSLMGALSLMRQTLLNAQYSNQHTDKLEYDPSLEALLPVLSGQTRLLIEPGSVLMANRTHQIANAFGIQPILVASGQEWRRPDLVSGIDTTWIVPLRFPQAPQFDEEADWEAVELDLLRQWDWAPEIPAWLNDMGQRIALSLHGLSDPKAFRKHLRQAIDRGLSPQAALAGMTTVPAEMCDLSDQMGTLTPGKWANLCVVEGDYFDPESPIRETWIQGRRYPHPDYKAPKEEALESNSKNADTGDDHSQAAQLYQRIARSPHEDRPARQGPDTLLIRGATLWTCGPMGIMEEADLLVQHGHIVKVGRGLSLPEGDLGSCLVIDARGKHLTPGLIDAHSHSMIMGGVNEGTMPSTAMVRVADVVNSETDHIYYQLAGGLTVANLLHGSANPIGGQNAVIKLRWGADPDGLLFREAPAGIKFALGENVKQSNWGNERTTRFPQSRMGVPVFYENRFTAARTYQQNWQAFREGKGPRPRTDLELETLVEILDGRRWIHCHSYRQDEILVFLRVMEQFGIQVGTLQHVLEGYKVADEIAAHGAGASCFSDWWAYKFEVIDAIPYAGSLMHERGALVSFNSDDSDLARRMYLEAAKAVKYGNTPPEEALNFVTLYPAQQLRIDPWVGSLEVGKHADFALWSASPLDTRTTCLETWIEGVKFFDRYQDKERVAEQAREKAALIQHAKNSDHKKPSDASSDAQVLFFQRALEKLHEGQILHCDD